MVLLAPSPEALQAQLDVLQRYCEQWGLTVNTMEIMPILLSGARREREALATAQHAGLTFGSSPPSA